ncbi:hypothetical protein DV737_g321, partial [Chaetothyriales sp. CBS 132003]
MVVKNQDFRPSDYKGNTMKQYPRPSHADFTYLEKYGIRASSDPEVAARMEHCIADFRDRQDSIGGTVTCVIRNVPTGLGEPVFSKLEATLAHGMLSIPATKGFEIGSGFEGTEIPGSAHNDMFIRNPDTDSVSKNGFAKPKLTTSTNNSGGVQGGITNGAHIFFRAQFQSWRQWLRFAFWTLS